MGNPDDFIKRLEAILEYYSLTASLFADKLGVQRSGLSHLMSGRNKPSLDFVMKIVENFPEVDLYWLLNGVGEFPKNNGNNMRPDVIDEPHPFPAHEHKEKIIGDLFSQTEEATQSATPKFGVSSSGRQIERIVVFYNDGTFKDYLPSDNSFR